MMDFYPEIMSQNNPFFPAIFFLVTETSSKLTHGFLYLMVTTRALDVWAYVYSGGHMVISQSLSLMDIKHISVCWTDAVPCRQMSVENGDYPSFTGLSRTT